MNNDNSFKENVNEALQDKDNSNVISETSPNKVDVFLSYSSLNKNVADAVVSEFENNGIRCWYAPRDIMPGQEWVTAIHEAINTCRLFVLIYTDSSNESKQVANEVALAFNSGKTLIPFKLSDTEMSSELEYYLTRVHWLDAVNPPLMQSIKSLREYSEKILNGNIPKESKIRNANSIRNKQVSNKWLYPILAVLVVLLVLAIVLLVKNNGKFDNPDTLVEKTDISKAPEKVTDSPTDISVNADPTSEAKDITSTTDDLTPEATGIDEDNLLVDGLDADGLYEKAYRYQTASRIDSDYDRAYECYMETGDSLTKDEKIIEAINELAAHYYNDLDDEEKKTKALNLYDKAAACGSIDANNFLGAYYLDIDRDPDEVKYAASAYDGNAMTDALSKAIKYYEASAEKDDNIALYSLGYIYENQDELNNITHLSDNTYHDYEKALEYYEKAAKAGHTSAQAAYDRVKRLIEES